MDYTKLFSEEAAPLAVFGSAAATTEQNSGYVNLAKYHRIAVVLHAIGVGTTLDMDVEIATDAAATDVYTLKSMAQMDSEGDGEIVVVEIRTDELGTCRPARSGENYDWLNVEVTPSGSCAFSCIVYGLVPRYEPVDSTLWDQVITAAN